MKIAVVGAGAVGSYYGGLLARTGHEVTLVGRKQHVDAINERGLVLETQDFREHVRVGAVVDVSEIQTPDLVLFSVKSADTERAGSALSSRLRDDTIVLSLQNGVDNPQRLRAIISSVIIPSVVYVGVEMAGPGHVRHHGGGRLIVGPSSGSELLVQTFETADILVTIADDIERIQWAKLVTNCAYNALSAVANISYGPMIQVEGARELVSRVVQEGVAVARGRGILLPDDLLGQVLAIPAAMPAQRSSTAQDLARRKPTEIDFLNGYVVREGDKLGIPTPSNFALQIMVKLAERAALEAV